LGIFFLGIDPKFGWIDSKDNKKTEIVNIDKEQNSFLILIIDNN